MQFTFNVGYAIQGRPPARKQIRRYRFVERVAVEIPEISSDEAPIAVEWRVPTELKTFNRGDDRRLVSGGNDGKQFTRWYDGRHWLRLVERHSNTAYSSPFEGTTGLTLPKLMSAMENNGGYEAIGLARFSVKDIGPQPALVDHDPTEKFETLLVNERTEALSKAHAVPSNLLLVDGIVHVACAQPALRLSLKLSLNRDRFELGSISGVVIDTQGDLLDGYPGFHQHFSYPLTDWTEIMEMSQRDSDGSMLSGISNYMVTIHIPESIDPDIDARRKVDRLVKMAAFRAFHPDEAQLREFFGDASNQRAWRVQKMVPGHLASSPSFTLISRIQEIEDSMAIDIRQSLTSPPPAWGSRV